MALIDSLTQSLSLTEAQGVVTVRTQDITGNTLSILISIGAPASPSQPHEPAGLAPAPAGPAASTAGIATGTATGAAYSAAPAASTAVAASTLIAVFSASSAPSNRSMPPAATSSASGTASLIGPLTTTFTAPQSCTVVGPGGFQAQACSASNFIDASACWPPAAGGVATPEQPFGGWGYYSPGLVCPAGYATACSNSVVGGLSVAPTGSLTGAAQFQFQFPPSIPGERAVGCCPTGFSCSVNDGTWQTCFLEASSTSFLTGSCSGNVLAGLNYATLGGGKCNATAGAALPAQLSAIGCRRHGNSGSFDGWILIEFGSFDRRDRCHCNGDSDSGTGLACGACFPVLAAAAAATSGAVRAWYRAGGSKHTTRHCKEKLTKGAGYCARSWSAATWAGKGHDRRAQSILRMRGQTVEFLRLPAAGRLAREYGVYEYLYRCSRRGEESKYLCESSSWIACVRACLDLAI